MCPRGYSGRAGIQHPVQLRQLTRHRAAGHFEASAGAPPASPGLPPPLRRPLQHPQLGGNLRRRDPQAAWLARSLIDTFAYPDRTVDQLAERVLVHLVEALDVQATLSGLVRS